MGGSLDFHVPRLAHSVAALLAGASILMLPDVGVRTAAQAPAQPPAGDAAKQDASAQPRRTLELRILNARTGRPEPEVTVRPRIPARAEGKTDADGRFRIAGADREFTVVFIGISKPGFVPVQVMWDNAGARVAVPVPREHTVRLEPASTIGGFVLDEQGQPIAGARVSLSIPSSGNQKPGEPRIDLGSFQTRTDAEGRWKCELVPAKLDMLSMTVEHSDYVLERHPFWRRTESPQVFVDLEASKAVLVLKEGITLQGRVIDRDGRPIAGAQVRTTPPIRHAAATTDDRGRFELAHIAPGPIELAAQAKGYVPAQRKVAAGEAAPVEIRLEAGRAITGRLVNQANRPIAGASLQLELGPSNRWVWPTAQTDRDGRFRVEGVPIEGGTLVVRQGMNTLAQRVPPSPKDAELALTMKSSQVRLRIVATDADSRQPLPAFTVVSRGYMMGRQPATDGRFEMTFNRPPARPGFPALQVLIEAEGYFPSEPRKVPTDRDEVGLSFALKRGAAIAGIVRAGWLARGRAQLALRKPSERITFDGAGLRNMGVYPIFETDRDGRFSIPPQEGRFELVAAHPLGFAFQPIDSAAGRPETALAVKLRPWGRIEGVLKVGAGSAAGQEVALQAPFHSDISSLEVNWHATTPTDNQGHFVFERVLAGLITPQRTVRINPRHGLLVQPVPAIEVKPGETARVAIGGSGRPVVGRITVPEDLKARWGSLQPFGRISVEHRPPKPYEQLNAEEQARFDREWQKDHRSHAFLLQSDGSFRVEDIVPGEYQLKIEIHDDYEEPRFHGYIVLGKTERTITVPAIPGGRTLTDEPLDLGLIPFALDRGPAVGQPTPEIEGKTLDGTPIKLSDYRGKYVLLVFWQSETVLARAEALALKAVASGFAKDDRLVMLGLNADTQGDEAAARAAAHGWTWPQAKLGYPAGWELRRKFTAYQLPSIWLIGPDGRVVARDLKGAAIKEAVARALRDR